MTSDRKILIVEDDLSLRNLLTNEVDDAGFLSKAVASVEEAIPAAQSWEPDLVISDLRLPGQDGFSLLQRRSEIPSAPAFLIITAYGSVPQAVEALKAGADNFLTKPLDLDHLILAVRRALEVRELKETVQRFRERDNNTSFHGIVGGSAPMRRLFEQIRHIARADGPVSIGGESGTGKELVARAMHKEGPRARGPLIPVNCAGIPENLLESELFGHVAGSYTGAVKARKGMFDEADGGTLFLDEVGELPLSMQGKLLRVLQEGAIRPVGANREHPVNVRVVVATNRDLEEETRHGRFREDLFYRLEAFSLYVPALRERGDDLDLLAGYFLHHYAVKEQRKVEGFAEDALDCLHRHDFPGNVRELQNIVHRAVVFCREKLVTSVDLPERLRHRPAPTETAADDQLFATGAGLSTGETFPSMEEMKVRYTRYLLEKMGGNKRRTAALLGIGRKTLYRYIQE